MADGNPYDVAMSAAPPPVRCYVGVCAPACPPVIADPKLFADIKAFAAANRAD